MTKSPRSPGKILVGTASWSDPGFVEYWYPPKMPAGDRLAWYAEQFEMVEVNSTFYAAPKPRLIEQWCVRTPPGFVFNLKLHQLLSRHATMAKMLPPRLQKIAEIDVKGKVILTPALETAMVEEFRGAAAHLQRAGKLGALLLQLSPAFSPQAHSLVELDGVFDSLGEFPLALELRNRLWSEGEPLADLLAYLRKRALTLVSVDAPEAEHFTIMPRALDEITAPGLAYLRLHGRDARAYTTGKTVAARFNYNYNDGEIAEIAARAQKLAAETEQTHIVFNNNARDYAPHAAARLRQALGQVIALPKRQAELF